MHPQNIPNGLPPQQKQFNGVHSSHSSRDSSPSTRLNHIPPSQLPPGLNQSFQQLSVGAANNFGSSTPVGQQGVGFPQSNNCSPVVSANFQQAEQRNVGNYQPVAVPQMPFPGAVPQNSPVTSRGANFANSGQPYRNMPPSSQVLPRMNTNVPPMNFSGPTQQNNNFQPQRPYPPQNLPPTSQQPPQFSNVPLNQVPNRYPNYSTPQNNYSVSRDGFNKLWGTETYDLLQIPNILPPTKVGPPKINLGQEFLDAANCKPDVFRCTLTKIPETSSLLQKSRLPLGVLIHPFKDLNHLPVIQCNVIVRCRSCRTYINPFVFFVDSKRWKCNVCYRVNELPEEFQYDPVSKTYGDPSRRPEIKSSTIEYIAPAEYMLRPPQPAVYLFLLDISRLAIESGYLETFCQSLSADLANLPGDSRTQVGFLAYDSALHFFSLNENLSRPQEIVMVETDEIFLPCPDNLLVNLKDKMELVLDLLAQLPTRYNNSFDNGSALGAALQVAHKLMASLGGRITVFQASLPNCGPGTLTPREDPNQRGSCEKHHLNPATDFYKILAVECSSQQIAVDLFIINSQYVDVATISGISRFSGGCMYHFPLFKASRVLQNAAFERCLKRYFTRKIGFEAVMRIRCTQGLAIQNFHGNFFVRSTDLLSLPNINPDAGFGMQISIEGSLSDVQSVCFQAALLYTSSKGERRIRVHTLCVPTAATLPEILNSADQQCIVGLLAKMAVSRSMESSLSDAREALVNVAIDVISTYKLSLNMNTGATGLLVPNCLKLLPLYISALLKFAAFRTGGATRLDDRVIAMCDMKSKPLCHLLQAVYADLYAVHNLEEQSTILNEEEEAIPQPAHLQLTARNIDANGAYLLDTGDHMMLMVCPSVSATFLNQALGVPDYKSITDDMYELPLLENPYNQRLNCFVNYLNEEKPYMAPIHIFRENSPSHRNLFYERLIEDRVESALSYHEFLQHLKTQVK